MNQRITLIDHGNNVVANLKAVEGEFYPSLFAEFKLPLRNLLTGKDIASEAIKYTEDNAGKVFNERCVLA